MPDQDPLIVDVQGIGPVEFPAGTSGAQIQSWVINELRKAKVPPQTWGQYLGNMAVRVGGGIAGGVIGSLAGPVGTFAGTATGAAMGDEWAQSREVAQGVREAVNPLEMMAAGATAPIPGATLKRGAPLLRQVPRALAASVPGAAASSAGMQLAQTGTVDPWRLAMETGRGTVLGGVTGLGVEGGIRAAQSPAVQRLLRDETGAIRVYHGSPHDFDQFSTAKIGTGEGAQVYGHGLYFGEASDTGRSYRDAVGASHAGGMHSYDPDLRIGKVPVTDMYRRIDEGAARLPIQKAQAEYDKLEVLERLMQDGDVLGVREAAQAGNFTPEALAWFERDIAPHFKRRGRLYEVNIDADPEHFLDWDAPIEAQNLAVENAVARAWGVSPDELRQRVRPGARGAELYAQLARAHATPGAFPEILVPRKPRASAALNQAGVPGIKYLDQGSRDTGEGTSNYVVFDDQLVSILRKYGLLPFVPLSQVGAPQRDERKK